MILRARALAVALGSFSSVLNVGAMDETPRVSKVYAKQAGGAMEQARALLAAAHGQAPPKDRRHADMHRQLDMRRFAVQLTAEQQAERAATDKRRMEEQAARKEAQKKPRGRPANGWVITQPELFDQQLKQAVHQQQQAQRMQRRDAKAAKQHARDLATGRAGGVMPGVGHAGAHGTAWY